MRTMITPVYVKGSANPNALSTTIGRVAIVNGRKTSCQVIGFGLRILNTRYWSRQSVVRITHFSLPSSPAGTRFVYNVSGPKRSCAKNNPR